MKDKRLYIILVANLLLLLLALWIEPRYQSNDDIGMIYAYSGTAGFDVPTAVTAFSTKTWGLLMVFLYKVIPPGIEAYTVSIFILIFISNAIIHKKLLEKLNQKSPVFWLVFLPVLLFISIIFYLELQFTMVAGLLCFAGVMLTLHQPKRSEMVLGCTLVLLGSLLRPSVIPFVLALLFGLNFLATFLMPLLADSRWQITRKFLIFTAVLFAVYFTDKQIHTAKEKMYLEFNLFKGGIVDFSTEQSNKSSLPTNWEKEELFLFKNWFYNDPILYDDKKDYSIERNAQETAVMGKINLSSINMKEVLQQFKHKEPLLRCLMIVGIIPVFLIRQWYKGAIFLFLAIVSYSALYILLSMLFKSLPFRVGFMLLSSAILLHVYFVTHMMERRKLNFIFILPIVLLMYGLWVTNKSFSYRHNSILAGRCMENYNLNVMYIQWPWYPTEFSPPFHVSNKEMPRVKIINMNSFSIHPAVRNSFGDFKYNNLTNDIIGKDYIISFIMPEDTVIWSDFRSAYTTFIRKHYKRNVVFKKAENAPHCFGHGEFKLMEAGNAKLD